jgi:hypothetical protein
MIPLRVVDSTAKNHPQSDWDLTSSVTGTVKRRPTSLESCKSNSPTKREENIDFPDDNAKDVVSASCRINKPRKSLAKTSEEFDLSQEIAGGSRTLKGRQKIDNQPKKRFFDLKLAESAKKSFSSKLKLPNRVSLTLKTSPNANKLSLSQLEQQNNLFIRDGHGDDKKGGEQKINKIFASKNEITMEMRKVEGGNPKQKQDNLSKKSSLIPAFLGGSSTGTKSATNHIKIPSVSATSNKKDLKERLAKTGSRFRELYRDLPTKRTPPPYRPPPTPPATIQNKQQNQSKRIRLTENDARNYEEIDTISEENVVNDDNRDDISSAIAQSEAAEAIVVETKENEEEVDIMAKAEYSSNVFKNIPVRQKKGNVPHMENYCLFDPSVDFCNEKELMKKKMNSVRQFQLNENEESIEDVTFEDQTVYDVSELDEREKLLAHHNYYEIDPDLLLEEDEENDEVAVEKIQIERKQIVMRKSKFDNRKSKIYSNTLSTSSESTSTSQSSTNSSSTTTSSDYPSMFNSVIETTHSSTVESTDDNDSNGYGKVKAGQARTSSSQTGDDTINQVAVSNESVITISNVVTCGESNASTTGATKKKSPQLNRIIRPSSSSSSTATRNNKQQQTSLATTKTKSSKINLPFHNKSSQSDSLTHLENVTVQSRCRQQSSSKNELNFVIDNTTTIQLRRQHSSRQGRPLSGQSDDRDSGFLSPATPPDSQQPPAHITPNVIVKESEQNTKTESTLLNQCDNIQQLIEVSH